MPLSFGRSRYIIQEPTNFPQVASPPPSAGSSLSSCKTHKTPPPLSASHIAHRTHHILSFYYGETQEVVSRIRVVYFSRRDLLVSIINHSTAARFLVASPTVSLYLGLPGRKDILLQLRILCNSTSQPPDMQHVIFLHNNGYPLR